MVETLGRIHVEKTRVHTEMHSEEIPAESKSQVEVVQYLCSMHRSYARVRAQCGRSAKYAMHPLPAEHYEQCGAG